MPVSLSDARRADSRDRPPGPVPPRTRLWLDFVNTDAAAQSPGGDLLRDFEALLNWFQAQGAVDDERAAGIRRRAVLQPAAAAATLVDARRVRAALRVLAEKGHLSDRVRDDAVLEINRVLGRSAGTRRLDPRGEGVCARFCAHGGCIRRPDDPDRRIGGRLAGGSRAGARAPLCRSALPSRVSRRHEERTASLVRYGDLRQSRQGRPSSGAHGPAPLRKLARRA